MGQENNSWFARNRGLVFGFAIAILILNVIVLILVPTQTPISIEQTVTEYALDDEGFAVEHTVTLTGTLTKSMIHKNMFIGSLTISGVDSMEQPYPLELTRENGRWYGLHEQDTSPIYAIFADKDFGSILIVLWESREDGHATMSTASAHFLAPGTASRRAALTRFQEYPLYTVS